MNLHCTNANRRLSVKNNFIPLLPYGLPPLPPFFTYSLPRQFQIAAENQKMQLCTVMLTQYFRLLFFQAGQ